MCGRFDTSHLTWADIHAQLSKFGTVTTTPLNLEPNDDVRPTTHQVTARLENGAWELENMRTLGPRACQSASIWTPIDSFDDGT